MYGHKEKINTRENSKNICVPQEHDFEAHTTSLIQTNGVKCKKCGAVYIKVLPVLENCGDL